MLFDLKNYTSDKSVLGILGVGEMMIHILRLYIIIKLLCSNMIKIFDLTFYGKRLGNNKKN